MHDPDDLAEAERSMRAWRGGIFGTGRVKFDIVMDNYDRLKAVEKAAAEYALSCLCNGGTDSPELNADISDKFGKLLDAVRTNGEFRG